MLAQLASSAITAPINTNANNIPIVATILNALLISLLVKRKRMHTQSLLPLPLSLSLSLLFIIVARVHGHLLENLLDVIVMLIARAVGIRVRWR